MTTLPSREKRCEQAEPVDLHLDRKAQRALHQVAAILAEIATALASDDHDPNRKEVEE